MKQIQDQQLRQILNTLDQAQKRVGQAAYDHRPIDAGVLRQIADALRNVSQQLVSLPSVKENAA